MVGRLPIAKWLWSVQWDVLRNTAVLSAGVRRAVGADGPPSPPDALGVSRTG